MPKEPIKQSTHTTRRYEITYAGRIDPNNIETLIIKQTDNTLHDFTHGHYILSNERLGGKCNIRLVIKFDPYKNQTVIRLTGESENDEKKAHIIHLVDTCFTVIKDQYIAGIKRTQTDHTETHINRF